MEPNHPSKSTESDLPTAPGEKSLLEESKVSQERKDRLLDSRLVARESVTVIRPPSFSLGAILSGVKTLVGYRDLLYTLTLFRLVIRYKQSVLGWIWAILQPLLTMMVYTFVFSRVANIKSEGMPYTLFVFSGLLPWLFFSSAVSNAISGLVGYSHLLTKLHFPREIIPLSYVLASLVDFGIACIILSGLMVCYRVPISWKILDALPVIVILVGFTSAIALFLSSIQVRIRDIAVVLPVLLQVGVFVTPVVYSINAVPARFHHLYLLNPIASLIENFRRVVLLGVGPDISMLVSSGAITLCCLFLAYGFFKATEATMADVI